MSGLKNLIEFIDSYYMNIPLAVDESLLINHRAKVRPAFMKETWAIKDGYSIQ